MRGWPASTRWKGSGEGGRSSNVRAAACWKTVTRWIGQLETLFQDGRARVAVGAVHLVGQDGCSRRCVATGYNEAVPL
jgi:hypothetical protein